MPMIDVTALAGTEARISSVERRSVLQLHSASSPTRTARRAHLFWTSHTSSIPACEPGRVPYMPTVLGEWALALSTAHSCWPGARVAWR
jgi:hypothetical protein